MNYGWIKVHRDLLENCHFRDPEWVSIWLYLHLKATHSGEKKIVRFGGDPVELGPGQLLTNRMEIAAATGINESKVKRVLALMKSDQQIDQQISNKNSIITLLKWDFDQKVTSKLTKK